MHSGSAEGSSERSPLSVENHADGSVGEGGPHVGPHDDREGGRETDSLCSYCADNIRGGDLQQTSVTVM